MTKATTANYSPAQEAKILASAVNGAFSLDIAKVLADDPEMKTEAGEARTPRAIVAKMSRMVTASGGTLTYTRKVAVSKSGGEIAKKADIVKLIAERAGVAVAKLDGLEKSPKLALETLRDALAG